MGAMTARLGFFSKSDTQALVNLVFYLIVPVMIFTSLLGKSSANIFNWPYLLTFFIVTGFVSSISFILSKFYYKHAFGECVLNMMAGSHTNSVYLALPLFSLLFHDTNPVIGIIFFQNLLNILYLLGLEKTHANRLPKQSILKWINIIFIKNPVILAAVLGVIFVLFNIQLPYFISNTLLFIGKPGEFLALFALGLTLILDNKPIHKKDVLEVTFLVILKNLLSPFMAFIIGYYFFNLSEHWLMAVVLMALMPTAKNNFIFAKKYNVNPFKYSWVVLISTVLSLFLVSFIVI